MEKATFTERFLAAVVDARDVARRFVIELLPDALHFRVRLNSSHDGNRLHPDEVVYPEDGSLERAESVADLSAEEVIELLWRDGRVPEWINVSVIGVTGARTILEVLACGRYTRNEERLYHRREGRPPFMVTSPGLPPGSGLTDTEPPDKFSIHWMTECWTPGELDDLGQHAGEVRSLSLCGRRLHDEHLASLPPLPRLESLSLRGVTVQGPGLRWLVRAPSLQWLSVVVADSGALDLTSLATLPELRSVHLGALPALLRGFHRLGEVAPALDSLSLAAAEVPTFDGPMPAFPVLRSLRLAFPRLELPAIDWGRGLRTISLHVPTATDDEVVALVRHQPQLDSLHLAGTSVSDALLRRARCWWRLQFLDVSNTRVTERAVEKFVKRRPNIKVLPRQVNR